MSDWICETCVHYPPSSMGGKPCTMCNPDDPVFDHYAKWEETPPTNADRIRAGSNEHIAGVVCTGCPPGIETGKQCTGDGACYDCWLNWLQSPADGGGEDG